MNGQSKTKSVPRHFPSEGNVAHIKRIKAVLDSLKEKDIYSNNEDGFLQDKQAIERIFAITDESKLPDVLIRLTVIDSMYSTQMNRRYYALDEIAEKIVSLNNPKKLFAEFVSKLDIHLFDGKIKNEKFNLFSEKYGIGKDGTDKGVAVSLISKYAYFDTGYKFPIYDSIACEMYPRIWKYCGWKDKMPKLFVKDDGKMTLKGDDTMVSFISAIDELIKRLGGNISYDYLDRLLWFTGKIYRGNIALVVSRQDYEWCVKNWHEKDDDGNFDITKIDVAKAPFCISNSRLKAMFELAKDLKTNN